MLQSLVKALFSVIKKLQEQNISILFVSHKLDEVFEIAERFTVLRNGKNVASGNTNELDQDKFTYYMTGRKIKEEPYIYVEKKDSKTVLEVKNLSLKNGFDDISFSVKQGEILGITGLLGSGRTELVESIFGYNKADSGEIFIGGEKAIINNVRDGIAHGIGYIPPERIMESLFLSQSIGDNISITQWKECSNKIGIINEKEINESVDKWVESLSIKIHSSKDPVRTLSGGNQQKCVLAKWLAIDLKVLILNGPTVGVDIGAKFDIYKLIKESAAQGLAVIIISDDLSEVLTNCNRILVMRQGKLAVEKLPHEVDASELIALVIAD